LEINKNILTQNQINKKKEKAKFNVDPIKEFANAKNREAFGHICDDCFQKWRCSKWHSAIIIKCESYSQKTSKSYRRKY
jgi:hypothetical protein